jgi:integration host factor subunit alpha
MTTLTRSNISESIHKKLGFSISESAEMVDFIIDDLVTSLKANGEVKISSFGTFEVRSKAARIGRNPKTKAEAIIKPRKVVSFYISNVLFDKINAN